MMIKIDISVLTITILSLIFTLDIFARYSSTFHQIIVTVKIIEIIEFIIFVVHVYYKKEFYICCK